jgi:diguanylate cyclase (GGDEF)-like protein
MRGSAGLDLTGELALFGAVIDTAPQGFSVWDHGYRLVMCNRAYRDLYGFLAEDVPLGMTLEAMSELTVRMGNHPGATPRQMFDTYVERMENARSSGAPLRTEKPIRGRVIATTHTYVARVGCVVMHEDITEQTEQKWMSELTNRSLATQKIRFEAALDNMSHGLSIFDAEMRIVVRNQRYLDLYDLPPDAVRPGTPLTQIAELRRDRGTAPVDMPDFVKSMASATGPRERFVETTRLENGRSIQVTRSPIDGGGFVAVHQDITEDIELLEALRRAERSAEKQNRSLKVQNDRFDAAINNMTQGLCMFDKHEQLVVCNARYAQIYNLPRELVEPGTTLAQIVAHRFAHGAGPKAGRAKYLSDRQRLGREAREAKDEIELEDGRTIFIHHRPMKGGGWVATHEDVTEQRRIEARVRHLARHDALTDLPNRAYVREQVDKVGARIQRKENVAVLCLDLDHFKAVNDTLGHSVGDQVLVEVATRLRRCARENDVVARLGGDEFAVIAVALDSPNDAATIAGRIVKLMTEPMEIDGHQINIGASVGIALAPTDGGDVETLLRNADTALYRAKSEGRGNYHFFERGMDDALQHRRMLEQGLKVALARSEFRLMYQPLLDLETNRICCFEALLRWDHPDQGTISPTEFIPVAEETGLISAIGEWVLREACRTASQWPEAVRIAVNLSPAQFKQRGLVDHVVRAMAEAGLSPQRLELEVTESLLLAETDSTLETLHRLRELGVRISMDDFGTGYSSLSYLRAFPFDKIKIDRTFVAGLKPGDESTAIIKAVVGLGRSLGMSTTAEGIETEAQLEAVREQGCNEVQGFLFSPPLPASGIPDMLRSERGTQELLRKKA